MSKKLLRTLNKHYELTIAAVASELYEKPEYGKGWSQLPLPLQEDNSMNYKY